MPELETLRGSVQELCVELERDILLSSTREQHLRACLRLSSCTEILKMLDSPHE